jgi:starch synthase
MSNPRILYVCQEITPYLPESGMASLCRLLSQAMQERGGEIRTFMPRWGTVNERRNQLHEVIRLSGMNLIINDNDHQLIIKVASIPAARVQIYFIDNEDYFSRKATLADEQGVPFADNDDRALFFARGVLETVRKLRWTPDIVHCHGWFTGLVPMYLRGSFADDPLFNRLKIVVSLHDDAFPGELNPGVGERIAGEGAPGERVKILSQPTYRNFMKFVMEYADATVVDTPAPDPEVLRSAREGGKPVMEYLQREDAEFLDKYRQFYDELLAR